MRTDMATTPTPTQALFQTLKDYKDPFTKYLHRDLKKPYETKSAAQLRDIRKALKAGAKWKEARASAGDDAPFAAAFFEDPRPLALMLDAGVPLDHTSARRPGSLMHHAASFGRTRVIQLLADRGASVLAKDKFGQLPLDSARAWRHGEDALPLLTRLTKRALKQAPPGASEGDLAKKAMLAALPKAPFSKNALRGLEKFVKASFAATSARTSANFLEELSGQLQDEVVAAGLWLVAQATTSKPTVRREKGGEVRVFHHGDLVIDGAADAVTVAVTGSLTVKGRLTNWEGRGVYVGGSLRADAVVTEGPLWVQRDAQVKRAVYATSNDYGATVVGTLRTPVLVQDEHQVVVGKKDVRAWYRSKRSVPEAEWQRIAKQVGLKK